jgi:uncharacterized protein YjbJ (UPF0337 family)
MRPLREREPRDIDVEENFMKPSTQDKAEGTIHVLKGKIKEAAGKATNDPDLEDSGSAEKIVGKGQKLVGRLEKALDN